MALTSVLVDRARRVYNSPTAEKVEGTTVYRLVTGPWFKVRVTAPQSPNSEASQRVQAGIYSASDRETATLRPTLLMGIKDTERGSLIGENGDCVVRATDHLEVDSAELGHHFLAVNGPLTPLRKKRKIIGYSANAARLEEHEAKRLYDALEV